MAKQIKISELTAQINEGWKIEKLVEFYELPTSTMRNVLKQAGLTIRKFKKPLFELIDDTTVVEKDPSQLDLFQTVQTSEDTLHIAKEIPTASIPAVITPSTEPTIVAFEAEKQATLPITLLDDSLDNGISEDVLAEMAAVLMTEEDPQNVEEMDAATSEEIWDL